MLYEKQIAIGTKWTDNLGRTWIVERMLAFGRYYVVTADGKRTAEMRTGEILLAIGQHRRTANPPE